MYIQGCTSLLVYKMSISQIIPLKRFSSCFTKAEEVSFSSLKKKEKNSWIHFPYRSELNIHFMSIQTLYERNETETAVIKVIWRSSVLAEIRFDSVLIQYKILAQTPLIAIKTFNRKTKESRKYQFSFQIQHFEDFVATMNKNGIKVISQNNSKETEDQITSKSFDSSFNGSYNSLTSYSQPNFSLLNKGTPISMYGSQHQILQVSSQMMDPEDQSQKEKGDWSQNKLSADDRKAGDEYSQPLLAVKKASNVGILKDQNLKTPINGSWSENDLENNIRERLKNKKFTELVSQQPNDKNGLLKKAY